MIKVGVIGCGYWGPNLVRTLNDLPGVKVAAVSDLRPGRLEFIQRRYPNVRITTAADDLIQDREIHALVIATPPQTHYALAMAGLDAGKHLLVEKPLTMDVGEGEEMVHHARAKGLVLMTGHLFLYAPAITELRRQLAEGSFGEPYMLSSIRANLGPPDTKVDALWDLAPHDISVVLDLMGDLPVTVRAEGAKFTNPDFIEAAFITLTFPGGRIAHVEVSWLSQAKVRLMRLICSEKTAHFDDSQQSEKLRIYNTAVDSRVSAGKTGAQAIGYGPGSITIPSLPTTEPLRAECEDFMRSIVESTPAISSGEKGLEVVRVLAQASKQIAERQASPTASRVTG